MKWGLLSWARHVGYTVSLIPVWIRKSCQRFDRVAPDFIRAKMTFRPCCSCLLQGKDDSFIFTLKKTRACWYWRNSISYTLYTMYCIYTLKYYTLSYTTQYSIHYRLYSAHHTPDPILYNRVQWYCIHTLWN